MHAGLAYVPGSLKARLVRSGVTARRAYCLERGLGYDEVGKVLVALDSDDDERLHGIHARAEANGVPGVRWITPGQLHEVEPHAVGRAALHSPSTAIVDAAARTATVTTGCDVTSIDVGERTRVTAKDGRTVSADLIVAAGLNADRLASVADDSPFRASCRFAGSSTS